MCYSTTSSSRSCMQRVPATRLHRVGVALPTRRHRYQPPAANVSTKQQDGTGTPQLGRTAVFGSRLETAGPVNVAPALSSRHTCVAFLLGLFLDLQD